MSVPIAIGENVYTSHQFADYLARDALDYVQADVVRVGGISPWLEIAALAAVRSRPMAPHFLVELSGQLLLTVPNAHIVEDVAGGSLTELGVLSRAIAVQNGAFEALEELGHGIEFDRDALEPHRLRPTPPDHRDRLWHAG